MLQLTRSANLTDSIERDIVRAEARSTKCQKRLSVLSRYMSSSPSSYIFR